MKKAEEYIEEVGHGLYTSYNVKDEKNKFTEVMSEKRAVKAIKQAQIDAIDATINECTKHLVPTKRTGRFKHIVAKDSILSVADKLKKELNGI